MSTYKIISSAKDIPTKVQIKYSWFNGGKIPPTSFELFYDQKNGFYLNMRCEEQSPQALYLNNDDPVYKDSCMEFFIDFYPNRNKGYMNLEINSKGAFLCMFGKSRENRVFIKDIASIRPNVKSYIHNDYWVSKAFIPNQLINDLYGDSVFGKGDILRGNFYKCGDETAIPHWGSWHTLGETPLDFHQPETFGEFIII